MLHLLNDSERQIDFQLLTKKGEGNTPPQVKRFVLIPTKTVPVTAEELKKLKEIPLFAKLFKEGKIQKTDKASEGVEALME